MILGALLAWAGQIRDFRQQGLTGVQYRNPTFGHFFMFLGYYEVIQDPQEGLLLGFLYRIDPPELEKSDLDFWRLRFKVSK